MSVESVKAELKALEDKLRGIKAPNGTSNGHNFHRGATRKAAIRKAAAKIKK